MTTSITNHDLPLGLEVRHLAALEAVGRTSSFSQAAQSLGYAQSAVSQQIAALERIVGHKLVERPGGPRPVSLTQAGEVLLVHAAHITARLGAAKADLDALAAGTVGNLRVGTFQSASARLLPDTLKQFRELWPRVAVQLHNELSSATLEEMVRAGQLDVAFCETVLPGDPFDSRLLIEDPFVAILPPEHELAHEKSISLHQLIGFETIVTCSVGVGQQISAAIVAVGGEQRQMFRSDDNLTTQRLVAAGAGASVLPLLAVEPNVPDAKVAILKVRDRVVTTRQIHLIWHVDRFHPPAVASFVSIAADVAKSVEAKNEAMFSDT